MQGMDRRIHSGRDLWGVTLAVAVFLLIFVVLFLVVERKQDKIRQEVEKPAHAQVIVVPQ
jgi:hypothetical protein